MLTLRSELRDVLFEPFAQDHSTRYFQQRFWNSVKNLK